MATVQSSIEAALFARVNTLVLSPALPIAWPNFAFPGVDAQGREKPKPASYLRVMHMPNAAYRLCIGSGSPHQRQGLLQLDVFQPLNKGATAATELAETVAEHFPTDLKLRSGTVTLRVTKFPDIAQAFSDSTHWQVPVTVAYECFA
ncbi:hypothetical protein C7I85_11935 [Mesorhizobium soli]|uniref:DUF3168 domain-containing protein n=1 Tax=Pseudaminobacter soli (ex Li et al. 2025) TaxID=1295366 RepID=A0A2P7SEQ3_9HYPH|nr:hypothetical protein C7I85_11935 [Mesorhizobium soli]